MVQPLRPACCDQPSAIPESLVCMLDHALRATASDHVHADDVVRGFDLGLRDHERGPHGMEGWVAEVIAVLKRMDCMEAAWMIFRDHVPETNREVWSRTMFAAGCCSGHALTLVRGGVIKDCTWPGAGDSPALTVNFRRVALTSRDGLLMTLRLAAGRLVQPFFPLFDLESGQGVIATTGLREASEAMLGAGPDSDPVAWLREDLEVAAHRRGWSHTPWVLAA